MIQTTQKDSLSSCCLSLSFSALPSLIFICWPLSEDLHTCFQSCSSAFSVVCSFWIFLLWGLLLTPCSVILFNLRKKNHLHYATRVWNRKEGRAGIIQAKWIFFFLITSTWHLEVQHLTALHKFWFLWWQHLCRQRCTWCIVGAWEIFLGNKCLYLLFIVFRVKTVKLIRILSTSRG